MKHYKTSFYIRQRKIKAQLSVTSLKYAPKDLINFFSNEIHSRINWRISSKIIIVQENNLDSDIFLRFRLRSILNLKSFNKVIKKIRDLLCN
jgi:hypothetical protein